jgi:5-methylcytosine-specific restriction protein A
MSFFKPLFPTMYNPKWHQDEIILALDLYFSPIRGPIDKKNPNIIELSKILNELPLFSDRPDEDKFRNANGVSLKLSNFLALDDNYKGSGMTGWSKLDKELFHKFQHKPEELKTIAIEIKRVVGDDDLRKKIYLIEDDEVTDTDSVEEGHILYKLHKYRERNRKIVAQKKKEAMSQHGKLACEACELSFDEFYGEIGRGFIECHHLTPMAKLKVHTRTTLDSLSLVCSNCHRMLHRKIDSLSVEDLRMMIKYQRH